MKKLLLLFVGLAAFNFANAIELTFVLGDQKITPGQTVKFTDIKIEDYDDYKEVYMMPDLNLTSNIYSSSVNVTATCTSGQSIQMCIAGKCHGGETVTLSGLTVRPNQNLNLGFEYIDYELAAEDDVPTVITVFEAVDTKVQDSAVQFILEMSEEGAGVSSIVITDDFKPVDGGIAYKTETECPLTVATLSGINVYSSSVSGEGFVALPAGLYVFTFGDRSGKIYIR